MQEKPLFSTNPGQTAHGSFRRRLERFHEVEPRHPRSLHTLWKQQCDRMDRATIGRSPDSPRRLIPIRITDRAKLITSAPAAFRQDRLGHSLSGRSATRGRDNPRSIRPDSSARGSPCECKPQRSFSLRRDDSERVTIAAITGRDELIPALRKTTLAQPCHARHHGAGSAKRE